MHSDLPTHRWELTYTHGEASVLRLGHHRVASRGSRAASASKRVDQKSARSLIHC